MNTTSIIGNLTADPELRQVQTQDGMVSVCSFSIAVNSRRKEGQTTFFRCTAWRQAAEIIHKYARKGHKLYVSGQISTRVYTPQGGEPRASLDLTVEEFEFLTSKSEAAAQAAPAAVPASNPAKVDSGSGFAVDDGGELPF